MRTGFAASIGAIALGALTIAGCVARVSGGTTAASPSLDLSASDLGAVTVGDGAPPSQSQCSKDGWCVVPGIASSNNLHGVWGSGADHVWAAGNSNLEWRNMSWVATGGISSYGVWGSGPGDVWVVGMFGNINRWDGSQWSPFTSRTDKYLRGVWGSGPSDVWAVGYNGMVTHWDNSSGSPIWTASMVGASTDTFFAVWESSNATDVWAVGTTTAHRTSTWSISPIKNQGALYGIWGDDAKDIWTVGSQGEAFHYDGMSWSSQNSDTSNDLNAVWGSGSTDIWAVGARGVIVHGSGFGTSWLTSESGVANDLYGIWGSGPHDIWAVGDGGTILHRQR